MKHFCLLPVLILILLSIFSCPTGTGDQAQRIDNYFTWYTQARVFCGSVLVAKDGAILLEKGYGRNMATGKRYTANTPIRIASLSKQFTAMAMMILDIRGDINISNTLSGYLPDYPGSSNVTIHQLLTHTSGLNNYYLIGYDIPLSQQPMSRGDLYSYLKTLGYRSTPGSQCYYANTNYSLPVFIIESVTGLTYDRFMQQNIFGPLGMVNSGDNTRDDLIGHMISTQGLTPADDVHPSILPGSASIYSTAHDLYLWDRALYTTSLVPQVQMDRMFTSHVVSNYFPAESAWYGYGWFIRERKIDGQTHHNVFHSGNLDTSHVMISRYTDDDAVIIILADVGTNYLHSALATVESILFE